MLDLMPSLVLPDRAGAERYLERLADEIPADVTVGTRVLRGRAADELLRHFASTPDAIVVMSTHGRGGLGRLVFGSVADKVMRAAPVPVVLIREDGKLSSQGLRNLLVPLDGSELAEAMLPLAVELARNSGAALHLVRIVEPFWTGQYIAYAPEAVYLNSEQIGELEAEAQAEARTYLDDTATGLRAQDIRVVWEVRVGKPADEIVRAAQTTDADLILMSSHGRGGLRRWAFGSVANEVLHRGVVPVMILPQHMLAGYAEREPLATTADG
jgi:nucleotide-binding universal stress UspA family protein